MRKISHRKYTTKIGLITNSVAYQEVTTHPDFLDVIEYRRKPYKRF